MMMALAFIILWAIVPQQINSHPLLPLPASESSSWLYDNPYLGYGPSSQFYRYIQSIYGGNPYYAPLGLLGGLNGLYGGYSYGSEAYPLDAILDELALSGSAAGLSGLDLDGDGLADVAAAAPATVLSHSHPVNGGRRAVGPPLKVYQHKRTLHVPSNEEHYVQKSVGPAYESHNILGQPLSSFGLKSPLQAYGAHYALRRRRSAEEEENFGSNNEPNVEEQQRAEEEEEESGLNEE